MVTVCVVFERSFASVFGVKPYCRCEQFLEISWRKMILILLLNQGRDVSFEALIEPHILVSTELSPHH
jgi:hypothetical protein